MAVDREVVLRRMGESTVLVSLATDQMYTLNETGTLLFELIASGSSTQEIHDRVREEYEIEPAEIDREIDRLTAALRDAGILVPAELSSASDA